MRLFINTFIKYIIPFQARLYCLSSATTSSSKPSTVTAPSTTASTSTSTALPSAPAASPTTSSKTNEENDEISYVNDSLPLHENDSDIQMKITLDFWTQCNLPEPDNTMKMANITCFCDDISGTDKSTFMATPTATAKKKNQSVQTDSTSPLAFLNDRQTRAFCGVEEKIIKFLSFKVKDTLKESKMLTREKKIYILLARFKLFIPFSVLASFLNIGESTAKKAFKETLNAIYDVAKDGLIWFEKKVIKRRMPSDFKALFPDTRCIIDCSEITCERAPKVRQRALMYSSYKSNYTVKFLVAVAPSGEIMFVSKAYGGRMTDTAITCNSGFLQLIEEGDLVMSDKGFPSIERNINEAGGLLVMPPFKHGERQFSAAQNQDGYKCAKVRVHVERAIGRLKNFEILNFVPIRMLPHIDKTLTIVCFLTNLLPDLIKST